MTREIKFRVWDKEYKNMFPVFTLSIGTQEVLGDPQYASNLYNIHFVNGGGVYRKIDDVILMQYTGLKDKNGKEIYEGDILFKFGIDDAPYVVKFGEQSISHDWQGVGFYTEYGGEIANIFGGSYVEVIGNIYENPDLLTL